VLTQFKNIMILSKNLEEDSINISSFLGFKETSNLNIPELGFKSSVFELLNSEVHLLSNIADAKNVYENSFDYKHKNESIFAICLGSNDFLNDYKKFSELGLNPSKINSGFHEDRDKVKHEIRFFSFPINKTCGLRILISEASEIQIRDFGEDVITKINQVVVYASEMESLKELFESKLGVRLALDQEFDFGQGKNRMMFFKIGGVTIEIVEDTKINKNSYSGIGWHCDSISLNHKRFSERGFSISPIRKGRKEGTLVSTIKDAPLSVPTIIIGSDKE